MRKELVLQPSVLFYFGAGTIKSNRSDTGSKAVMQPYASDALTHHALTHHFYQNAFS